MNEIICFAEGAVFDASQYAFFTKDVVEEVELGGLEDDDHLPAVESNEFFFLNKEEVNFQYYDVFSSSKFSLLECIFEI